MNMIAEHKVSQNKTSVPMIQSAQPTFEDIELMEEGVAEGVVEFEALAFQDPELVSEIVAVH